jgi:hypothetical protein
MEIMAPVRIKTQTGDAHLRRHRRRNQALPKEKPAGNFAGGLLEKS